VCFQAEDGIRDATVTGVQTCALPIWKYEVESHQNHLGGANHSAATSVMISPAKMILVRLNFIFPPAAFSSPGTSECLPRWKHVYIRRPSSRESCDLCCCVDQYVSRTT